MISRRLIWMGLETFEVLNQGLNPKMSDNFSWILDGYKNVRKDRAKMSDFSKYQIAKM